MNKKLERKKVFINWKVITLFLVAMAAVWSFFSFCDQIETRISQIPLAEMIHGAFGLKELLPLGISLLICLGSLLLILIITGVTSLTRPIGLLVIYSLLLPLVLLLSKGKTKEILIVAGFFGVALLYHLGGVAKEAHSRIKFSANSLAKGRSIVALILLVLIMISIYHGSIKLISHEGHGLQVVLEKRAVALIDRHVPKLVEGIFSSERVVELSKNLPAEINLRDLQKEVLGHLPQGSVIVKKAKEQAPKVIEFMQAEFQKTKKAFLKGPLLSLQNLYLLGALWSLLAIVTPFLGIAKGLSAIAGLLTALVIKFLVLTGIVTKVAEKVTLERLSF